MEIFFAQSKDYRIKRCQFSCIVFSRTKILQNQQERYNWGFCGELFGRIFSLEVRVFKVRISG
jgi:hypothetical protein